MKKMVFLGWLFVFLPAMVFAQEKVEGPVWNVGDKWVFDQGGPIEVIGCDAQCYSVKFSGGIFPKDALWNCHIREVNSQCYIYVRKRSA